MTPLEDRIDLRQRERRVQTDRDLLAASIKHSAYLARELSETRHRLDLAMEQLRAFAADEAARKAAERMADKRKRKL